MDSNETWAIQVVGYTGLENAFKNLSQKLNQANVHEQFSVSKRVNWGKPDAWVNYEEKRHKGTLFGQKCF